MHISRKLVLSVLVTLLLLSALVVAVFAVSGALFTTFNAHVDGKPIDLCKNSVINCNIYSAKEYVWINGGPAANGLGPDGQYFFAVLMPGGQPNPNDGGFKNLSDDYDCYLNRTFTIVDGEVAAYTGSPMCDPGMYPFQDPHWLDSGKKEGNPDLKPNGLPPYIRLFPYADTTNPGGVYIAAVCYIGESGELYPVNPRDCKYDAFKVSPLLTASFMLEGYKFEDIYADGVMDDSDPRLPGWDITIFGTGFLGEPIDETVTTGGGGYWSFQKDYTYDKKTALVPAELLVCEVLQDGWMQSYPAGDGCHHVTIQPEDFAFVSDLNFGNYVPVDVTACKEFDPDGIAGGDTEPVAGWEVSLTEEGIIVDTQLTGEDGCYTWTGLTPGIAYDVHEGMVQGWIAMGPVDYVFERARSGASYSYTFVNTIVQGCTPGFWQGGSAGGQAGGQWLWNEDEDPDWVASGGLGWNPYIWTTPFDSIFTFYAGLDGFDMMSLVGTGGGADDFQKAARDLVAAYLNASWGMWYPYSITQLAAMWTDAVANGTFLALHTELDAANNAYYITGYGERCPISASIQ